MQYNRAFLFFFIIGIIITALLLYFANITRKIEKENYRLSMKIKNIHEQIDINEIEYSLYTSYDYLKTLGYVAVAYAWIKILEVSFKDYDENKKFYEDKINTAKFYFEKVLPRAEQHYKSAVSGSLNIMNFKFN